MYFRRHVVKGEDIDGEGGSEMTVDCTRMLDRSGGDTWYVHQHYSFECWEADEPGGDLKHFQREGTFRMKS